MRISNGRVFDSDAQIIDRIQDLEDEIARFRVQLKVCEGVGSEAYGRIDMLEGRVEDLEALLEGEVVKIVHFMEQG